MIDPDSGSFAKSARPNRAAHNSCKQRGYIVRFVGKESDPDYTVWDGRQWVGTVYRCPAGRFPQIFCGGCNGWHGYTHTVKIPGFPFVNIHGFKTRGDAASELQSIRAKWGRIIAASS
ncbi:hypothetical protein GCM10010341_08130 [Streptomyces noursei]|nr:hypothetical protein GCM10010341_08130 [Streptomyces noursei]